MWNINRMNVILVWNVVLACIIEQKFSQDEDESPYDWTTVESALSIRIKIFWTTSNLQLLQSFNMFCMPIENWMLLNWTYHKCEFCDIPSHSKWCITAFRIRFAGFFPLIHDLYFVRGNIVRRNQNQIVKLMI